MDSTNSLCSFSTLSFSEAGKSLTLGLPSENSINFIERTSTIELKFAPTCSGY